MLRHVAALVGTAFVVLIAVNLALHTLPSIGAVFLIFRHPIFYMNPFLTKKVLVVTAHPDDESPLAAGTIRQIVDSGGEVRLMCATLGENGRSHVSENISHEELKSLRRAELYAVASVLGLTRIHILQFADGRLADSISEFSEQIMEEVRAYSPDVIFSFGIDGYTGHYDHVAAYKAAAIASVSHSIPLVCFSLPPEPWRTACVEVLQNKRKFGVYLNAPMYPEPTIEVHVDEQAKLRAIQCHKTQLAGLDPYGLFPVHLARHILTHEYFIVHE